MKTARILRKLLAAICVLALGIVVIPPFARPAAAVTINLPTYKTLPNEYYTMHLAIDTYQDYAIGVNTDTHSARLRAHTGVSYWNYWRFIYMGDDLYSGGLYVIENCYTHKYLDVSDFGSGTDIVEYRNGRPTNNQLWYVVPYGNYYTLIPYCNPFKALDVDNGVLMANTNVHLWDITLGNTQLLRLIPGGDRSGSMLPIPDSATIYNGVYFIAPTKNTSYVVGAETANNGESMRIHPRYQWDEYLQWEFHYLRDGVYTIRNVGSQKYLDVSAFGLGDDVVQYRDGNPAINELWYVINYQGMDCVYLVPYCQTDMALDIHEGRMVSGQNVHLWSQTRGETQQLTLIKYIWNNDLQTLIDNNRVRLMICAVATSMANPLIILGSSASVGESDIKDLVEGTDYIVDDITYNNDGTATITVHGIGDYSGTATQTVPYTQEASSYTVSYDANGGSNAPAAQVKTHDVALTLRSTEPSWSGYTFMGWATSSEGDVAYMPGDTYALNRSATLYAVWMPEGYTISYDANGGSSAPAAQSKSYGEELTLTTEEPVREGYTFQGWAITSNGFVRYAPGSLYTIDSNITLYAVWKLNEYPISFDANGGEEAPTAQVKVHGEAMTITGAIPVREGYGFSGWATSQTGSVVYQPGGSYVTDAPATLYAKWTANQYTVSYDANGGRYAPSYHYKTHGIDLALRAAIPERNGYTFTGWATERDGEPIYQPGGIYTADASLTLYAAWSPNQYTIYYYAYDETTLTRAEDFIYSEGISLDDGKTLSREGHTFKGWSTTYGGSVTYRPGTVYNSAASRNLYAVWEPNTYEVTFDANGGNYAPAAQTKTYGVDLTLTQLTPSRYNYAFQGWAASADGEVIYAAGDTYTANESTTLYAIWQVTRTYTFTFDANGGTNAPEAVMKPYEVDIYLPETIPTRLGYTFMGWAYYNGGNVVYQAGGLCTEDSSRALYAVWQINKVSFDANGGSSAPYAQTCDRDGTVTLTKQKPSRSYYTFLGWAVAPDGEAVYQPGEKITVAENMTLYATWEIYRYNITYDANGGQNAPAPQVKVYDVNITLSPDEPYREGYVFKGWATYASSTSVSYKPGATFSSNSNYTLYAVWKPNEYTITYDANGAYYAPSKQTKKHGTDLTLTNSQPIRNGYDFMGWSTTPDGDVEYASSAKYSVEGDATLYAVWKIKTCVIVYDANGGKNAPPNQSKLYGETITLSTQIPTRKGHRFVGWKLSEGEDVYQPGDSWRYNNTRTTLYAVWEALDPNVCTLPASLKIIEAEAFAGDIFSHVVLPEGCESIGSKAFANCGSLMEIYIPETVTFIAEDAFEGTTDFTISTPATSGYVYDYAQSHGIAVVGE